MKCHYEVLQLERDATDDDIRKAYRKLALKWHPDKNLDNSEEAKLQFQLIQQAYEVLSDAQERSWYDRHRDSILKGGFGSDYQDDSLNVYQYFNSACFKGYGDDEKGFYAVYSEVFNKIGAEDIEFNTDAESDFEVPVFGNSKSSYTDVVHPFYSYWQSYSTKKTFSWLDKFDIRDAPNRRVLRLMEKENKKIRDKARKERNEEVRALVAFVRKRDKRVQEYSLYLEKKAEENEKKVQEFRKKQIIKRKEEISSYVECDWSKFSNLEGELKEIEANLAAEFDDVASSLGETSDSEEEYMMPHCLACKKVFKTEKALLNHEKSKKHKENLEQLEAIMKLENEEMQGLSKSVVDEECTNGIIEHISDDKVQDGFSSEEEHIAKPRKKKKNKRSKVTHINQGESDLSAVSDTDVQPIRVPDLHEHEETDEKLWKKNKTGKNKSESKKNNRINGQSTSNSIGQNKSEIVNSKLLNNEKQPECAVCNQLFSSKNELFKHLKSSGHAVPLTEKKADHLLSTKQKKKK
ncbi:hypothetical protein O3M35_011858 [Rhynocoris fuscipes]|uniref:DnaJ homolog subfamily C member 21 n=1 Tax=Rhynocoris fuscipes TaxID=488301 RepID=A0AAW1CZZ7_9HEMI